MNTKKSQLRVCSPRKGICKSLPSASHPKAHWHLLTISQIKHFYIHQLNNSIAVLVLYMLTSKENSHHNQRGTKVKNKIRNKRNTN